ncbi:MAG TPA: hypothetical protein PK636_00610 [bacterium]|nr:hypothetical protein [bacterium]HPJ71167.1 hypothetical protein [bacterium]HPQ65170.1 hypothetical protein [bacterium]
MARSGAAKLSPALLLVLAVTVLFLPALTARRGIFQDDQAMAEFPWHFFLARHFQAGEIPLWEPDTWCGAIPFYARYYADTYYWPLWPLYLLADTGNLDRAYWALSLVPLLLHFALAAVGMYCFVRRGMRLSRLSSFLAGWLYVFSPAFSYSYVWFPIVVVQAWLPWLLLLTVGFDRRPRFGTFAAAAAVVSLMMTAAQPPHLAYGLLLAFMLSLALGLRRGFEEGWLRALRPPGFLAGAVGFGFLLGAVYWFSMFDGMAHTRQHIGQSYGEMTGADGSMPPLYLVTAFVPELFDTVTGGRFTWGGDISFEARYWEANLQGGILIGFLALAGLLAFRGRRRRWTWFSGGLLAFAVLCVLGRHTPVYGWFYRLVPGITRFPFPIRYRLFQCVAVSWLCALGLESLGREPLAGRFVSARRLWGYLGGVGLFLVLVLSWPQDLARSKLGALLPLERPWAFPGLAELWQGGGSPWFFIHILPYLAGAGLILLLTWRGLRGRVRLAAVTGTVLFECAFFSATAFYYGTYDRRFPLPQHQRALRPDDHRMVATVLNRVDPVAGEGAYRWAGDRPFLDNFSRFTSARAFLGYDMKPLETRFKLAVEEAYGRDVDWPIYWSPFLPEYPGLLSAMSVKYFFSGTPDEVFPGEETENLGGGLYLHRNPAPYPPAYFQDRLTVVSAREEHKHLLNADLARSAWICNQLRECARQGIPVLTPEGLERLDAAAASRRERGESRFALLQQENRVTALDLSRANRVRAEVEVTRPALLVFSEIWYPGWKALVDGAGVPLYRVNYLQRGVWLGKGSHRVELIFRPSLWLAGAVVSLAAWTLLLAVGIFAMVRRRRRS